jgi:hypothetical protein
VSSLELMRRSGWASGSQPRPRCAAGVGGEAHRRRCAGDPAEVVPPRALPEHARCTLREPRQRALGRRQSADGPTLIDDPDVTRGGDEEGEVSLPTLASLAQAAEVHAANPLVARRGEDLLGVWRQRDFARLSYRVGHDFGDAPARSPEEAE